MNIAFVPVRIGSKGIPCKNVKDFCGRPLMNWVLEELIKCEDIDKIVLAHDSHIFEQLAPKSDKIEFYERSSESTTDEASTEMVMLEYINKSNLNDDDNLILVQVTNPFTTTEDFNKALSAIENINESVISMCEYNRPIWTEKGSLTYDYLNRKRRQDIDKKYYLENGAFYINSVKNIKSNNNRISDDLLYFIMPEYSQYDIDTYDDWDICELLFKKYRLTNN